jgi:5-methylcytosine-specific restriction protein A
MTWDHGKRSRHARGYGAAWTKLRARILARDCHLCQTCAAAGRLSAATAVDHIVPKAHGGTDDPSNLAAICAPCHREKTAAEAARAQGRKPRRRVEFGPDGRVIW